MLYGYGARIPSWPVTVYYAIKIEERQRGSLFIPTPRIHATFQPHAEIRLELPVVEEPELTEEQLRAFKVDDGVFVWNTLAPSGKPSGAMDVLITEPDKVEFLESLAHPCNRIGLLVSKAHEMSRDYEGMMGVCVCDHRSAFEKTQLALELQRGMDLLTPVVLELAQTNQDLYDMAGLTA